MTQNETSLYEMPADRMVFTHEGLGEGRELGEVEIVSTIWGNARVRVINKQGNSGRAWLLAILAALGVAAAVWLLMTGKETDSSDPSPVAPPPATSPQATAPQPAAPTASIQEVPAQNIPGTQAAPTPPVPGPVAPPETAKSARPEAEKAQLSAEKHQVAEKQIKRDAPSETSSPTKPAIDEKPGKTPAMASLPPASTATPHRKAKQPDAGKKVDSPASANPASNPKADPAKAEPSGSAQPAKPEPAVKPDPSSQTEPPVKADSMDSRP